MMTQTRRNFIKLGIGSLCGVVLAPVLSLLKVGKGDVPSGAAIWNKSFGASDDRPQLSADRMRDFVKMYNEAQEEMQEVMGVYPSLSGDKKICINK